TINGLVPIEQLKLGDLVLSKPEHGGELSYKPVTKTFEHDFQEVMLLQFILNQGPRNIHEINQITCLETNRILGRAQSVPGSNEFIVATANHPFFAKQYKGRLSQSEPDTIPQWTALDQLSHFDEIEALNGTTAMVGRVDCVHSGEVGFGFVPWDERQWSEGGYLFNMYYRPLKVVHVKGSPYCEAYCPPATEMVYDIEVQDNHTYYVGSTGLWVHNKNVGFKGLDPERDLTGSGCWPCVEPYSL
ncbi:MAG: polymorphic toxin-type HINT domain-containing protein, partial [Polaromonas sp.]